jgi:Dolichyl-phosphate-mannose-protein mannosyltransferase
MNRAVLRHSSGSIRSKRLTISDEEPPRLSAIHMKGIISLRMEKDSEMKSGRYAPILLAFLSTLAATLLIIHTYSVFNQTYDEPIHIACGMEWLDRGTYQIEPLHPPLARVAAAFLLYAIGDRSPKDTNEIESGDSTPKIESGNTILDWKGQYQRNLMLARMGVLPFFWLTCFLVWRFTAKEFSSWHGAIAVFLFAFCPVVLGHSGLATTDGPLMATFFLSVLGLYRLIQKPTRRTALLAGFFLGLGVMTKFTEIPFFLLAGGGFFLYSWLTKKRAPVSWKLAGLAVLALCLTIWAGYRFQHGSILSADAFHANPPSHLAHFANSHPAVKSLLLWPWIPANEFFDGLHDVILRGGVYVGNCYLLGQIYSGGRWDFFPVAILVKTPIPLLLLFLGELAWLAAAGEWKRKPAILLVVLCVLGPLLVCVSSKLNIGIRHVLPIYPFLAILGAAGAIRLWQFCGRRRLKIAAQTIVVLLLGWNLETCLRAAPDLFPYFNEAAAAHASYFLIDSDLDWGQDVRRLSIELQKLHVQSISLDLFGTRNLNEANLPPFHRMQPQEVPSGWVAVSEFQLKVYPQYPWLEPCPYRRVGTSIRLYYLRSGSTTLAVNCN